MGLKHVALALILTLCWLNPFINSWHVHIREFSYYTVMTFAFLQDDNVMSYLPRVVKSPFSHIYSQNKNEYIWYMPIINQTC